MYEKAIFILCMANLIGTIVIRCGQAGEVCDLEPVSVTNRVIIVTEERAAPASMDELMADAFGGMDE